MSSFIVLLFNFIPNPNQGQDTLGKKGHSFAGFANIDHNWHGIDMAFMLLLQRDEGASPRNRRYFFTAAN